MNDEGRGSLPTLTYFLHLSLSFSLSLSELRVLSFLLPIFFRLECHATYNTPGHESMAWLASKPFRFDPYLCCWDFSSWRRRHCIFHLCFLPLITHRCYTSLPLLSPVTLLWSVLKPNPQTIGYKSVLIVLFIHPLAKSFTGLGFEVNGRKEIKEIGKR